MSLGRAAVSAGQASRTFASFGMGQFARPCWLPVVKAYPPGVALFLQGNPPREVFFLEQGLLKLLRLELDGHELVAGLRATGWIVGAAAAILGRPYAVTAVTATTCRISRLGADEFRRKLIRDPALSWHVHEMHSRGVYDDLTRLADLATHSARSRLEQFLTRLASALPPAAANGEVRLELPLRQWELAQLLTMTPQYLCQLLGEMERGGRLRREGNSLILLGPQRQSAPSIRRNGGGTSGPDHVGHGTVGDAAPGVSVALGKTQDA